MEDQYRRRLRGTADDVRGQRQAIHRDRIGTEPDLAHQAARLRPSSTTSAARPCCTCSGCEGRQRVSRAGKAHASRLAHAVRPLIPTAWAIAKMRSPTLRRDHHQRIERAGALPLRDRPSPGLRSISITSGAIAHQRRHLGDDSGERRDVGRRGAAGAGEELRAAQPAEFAQDVVFVTSGAIRRTSSRISTSTPPSPTATTGPQSGSRRAPTMNLEAGRRHPLDQHAVEPHVRACSPRSSPACGRRAGAAPPHRRCRGSRRRHRSCAAGPSACAFRTTG